MKHKDSIINTEIKDSIEEFSNDSISEAQKIIKNEFGD